MEENMIAVAQIQDMVAHLKWRIDGMIFPPTSTSKSDPEHGNITIGIIFFTRHFKIVNLYNLHF